MGFGEKALAQPVQITRDKEVVQAITFQRTDDGGEECIVLWLVPNPATGAMEADPRTWEEFPAAWAAASGANKKLFADAKAATESA